MKKISIIIPVYNSEKYIAKCIDSILSQHGAELEIIVVNDGSSDGTLSVLSGYKDKILIKNIPNSGASAARNAGLESASGDFLMFLDSDDYLAPGAIEHLICKQNEYNADIVRFRYEYVYPDNSTFVPDCQVAEECFFEKSEFPEKIYPMFFRGIYLNSVCMSMFSRRTISDINFRTDMTTAEDAVFSLAAFSNAESVLFLPDILYKYYQSNEGLTGKGISILRKYYDNYIFAAETSSYLKKWEMNTIPNYIKVFLRPLFLTFDKLKRMKK